MSADTPARLYVQLGRLVRAIRQESVGAPVGPGGVSALVTLGAHPEGLRLGELAELEGVSAPSATRIVAALEGKELVRRTPDPDDGRALRVQVTDAGAALVATGSESRTEALRRRFERLDAADQELVRRALPALEALAAPAPVSPPAPADRP